MLSLGFAQDCESYCIALFLSRYCPRSHHFVVYTVSISLTSNQIPEIPEIDCMTSNLEDIAFDVSPAVVNHLASYYPSYALEANWDIFKFSWSQKCLKEN